MNGAIAKRRGDRCETRRIRSCRSSSRTRPIRTSTASTTAEEIWSDTDGKVDIPGLRRRHRRHHHRRRRGHQAAQAELQGDRRRAGRPARSSRRRWRARSCNPAATSIQGIGAGFVPGVLNLKIIDEVIQVTDDDAFDDGPAAGAGGRDACAASAAAQQCMPPCRWPSGRRTRAS